MISTQSLKISAIVMCLGLPACDKSDQVANAVSVPEVPGYLLAEYPRNELGNIVKVRGPVKIDQIGSYKYTILEGYTGFTLGRNVDHWQPFFVYNLTTGTNDIKLVSKNKLPDEGVFEGKWCQTPANSVFKLPENSFFLLISNEKKWPHNDSYVSCYSPIEK